MMSKLGFNIDHKDNTNNNADIEDDEYYKERLYTVQNMDSNLNSIKGDFS